MPVHDTTIITQIDTITITNTVFDTVINTVHDTTYINVPVHDTTVIIQTDTITTTLYDTITNTLYDTINNFIYDTTFVVDTLWLHDTIYLTEYIYDTIYIHDTILVGLENIETIDARIYTRNEHIVVVGANGNKVSLFDVNGKLIATKEDNYSELEFDVDVSGAYFVRIGNFKAKKIVVIK